MAQLEEQIIELINLASLETNANKKVEYLAQIKELALNQTPTTTTATTTTTTDTTTTTATTTSNNNIDQESATSTTNTNNNQSVVHNFFQDILGFQNERAPAVKKFVASFIEAACKHDRQLCPNAIMSLNLLINDSNTDVIKRSIQASTQFYKALILWIVDSNNPNRRTSDDEVEKTWLVWLHIQNLIETILESTSNDGIRTHCIKFIETVILFQTPKDKFTDNNYEFNLIDSLDEKPLKCSVENETTNGKALFTSGYKTELVEMAKKKFDLLVQFHGTSHISSVNLMATTQSLVVLAKQRSKLFMGRVIQTIETLNSKLPPTLTESQVQSVKKFLKLQLTVMLRHPYSLEEYQQQILKLLYAVGAKPAEINRVINDFKIKLHGVGSDQAESKRIKLEMGNIRPHSSLASTKVPAVGKTKQLDLTKLTQELDEKEKCSIVVESVKRILGDENKMHMSPAQMEIKKKVLSTLAKEFHDTECPKIIEDYIFDDLRNRHEISYAIIRKHFDVASAKAAKRRINLFDNQELLKDYFDCFNSYLNRAMDLKETKDRDIILPNLYTLRKEYYEMSGQDE